MKIFNFKVQNTEIRHFQDRYRRPWDDGRSYHKPHNLVLYVNGTIDDKPAAFKHTLGCCESVGLWNGFTYHERETDFLKITNKTEFVKSASPDIFPNAGAFDSQSDIQTKLNPGQVIAIKGRVKRDDSKIVLTHVKRAA